MRESVPPVLARAGCNGGQGASSGDLWGGDGAREPGLAALGRREPAPGRPAEPSELAALPYDVLQAIFTQLPLAVRPAPLCPRTRRHYQT